MNRRFGITLVGAFVMLVPVACASDDSTTRDTTSASPSSVASGTGASTSTTTTAPGSPTAGSGAETTAVESTDVESTAVGNTAVENTAVENTAPVLDTLDTTPVPVDTDPPPQLGLPADGKATVGGVDLPVGHILLGNDQRLAWITDDVVKGAAAVWKSLYDVRAQTGLYPVLLYDDGEPKGWEKERFFPNVPGDLETLDLKEVMQNAADMYLDEPRTFDGLAPASTSPADDAAADAAAAALTDTRILLVEAPRGADALSFMGWTGNATYDSTEALAVAVRSWEDRFGARVVAVGPSSVTLTISKPPASGNDTTALGKEVMLLDPDLGTTDAPPTALVVGDALTSLHSWVLWWK